MPGDTTKPRQTSARRRPARGPVLDLLFDDRRLTTRLRGGLVLGRDERVEITIDNEGLSRRHAKFDVAHDGAVQLADLESTNGSFVNGERITVTRIREHDELQFGPEVRGALRYVAIGTDPRGALAPLTDRQLHVACLVADGLTSAEIGARLSLSARTVDSHLARIYRRLEIRGRADLTRLVTQAGLAKLGEAPAP